MIDQLFNDSKARMEKTMKSFKEDLSKHRAGRASPDMLADVVVSYYGKDTPLLQMASVVVENALLLTIKPWDKKTIPAIQKGILEANLGLNPATGTDSLRVPLPPLTEDRRKELIKKAKAEGENAKVSIRNIRRDMNVAVKALLKDKQLTEDDERRSEEKIQKLTDQFIHEVDKVLAEKQKELMDI